MKNNQKIILGIVVVVLIVISIIAVMISNEQEENKKTNENNPNSNIPKKIDYLVVDNTDLFSYVNNNWQRLHNYENLSEKFTVYVNKEYFGEYYLEYIKDWNILDEDRKFHNYEGNILAYTNGINVKLRKYNIENITVEDKQEIATILASDITDINFSIDEKVMIDLDNNGIMDKIINVSNLDSLDERMYFNLLYVVINGEVDVLIKDIVALNDLLIKPVYNINYILGINNDIYDSILVREGYFSNNGETKNIIFQRIKDKYQQL